MEKRVVVTGIGVVSPVGNNVDAMWESIKAGKHSIAEITRFDLEGHKVTLAAEVKDFDFGDRRAAKRLTSMRWWLPGKLLKTVGSSAVKTWIRIVSAYTEARVSAASPPWNMK